MSTRYTVEYVDAEGAIHETIIRADDEEQALDLFAERNPDKSATIAYEREAA